MASQYRKYWLCGIIGAILFGIGDVLLGFVDPEYVSSYFHVLKAGHGAAYPLYRIFVTLFLGTLGIPFLTLGCVRMADIYRERKTRKIMRFVMAMIPFGWMIIHFTVSSGVWLYSFMMHKGNTVMAVSAAEAMISMYKPAQVLSWFMAGTGLFILPVSVLFGKTVLPLRSQWFTPALWMALFSGLKYFFPVNPLINALDTLCMNAGMIIWFIYLLFVTDGEVIYETERQ